MQLSFVTMKFLKKRLKSIFSRQTGFQQMFVRFDVLLWLQSHHKKLEIWNWTSIFNGICTYTLYNFFYYNLHREWVRGVKFQYQIVVQQLHYESKHMFYITFYMYLQIFLILSIWVFYAFLKHYDRGMYVHCTNNIFKTEILCEKSWFVVFFQEWNQWKNM